MPSGWLFVDTASLLDLVRDPTRSSESARTRQEADALLGAIASGGVELLLPEQVGVELDRNLDAVELESRTALDRHLKTRRAVEGHLATLGLPVGHTSLLPAFQVRLLDDVRELRRALLQRWRAHAAMLPTTPEARRRAVDRLNARRAPARDKKPEFPDCLIIESVFGEIDERRARNADDRAVFLTANTNDYGHETRGSTALRPPLDAEFARRGLAYATTFGRAGHLLRGGG